MGVLAIIISLFFACVYANDYFPLLLALGVLYAVIVTGIVLNESSRQTQLVFAALLIATIVFFAFRYTPEFKVSDTAAASGMTRDDPKFITYLYFSIVTFTTLGFGDITPMNHPAEVWLIVEVILGYVMLGGLISIFANKLARRS